MSGGKTVTVKLFASAREAVGEKKLVMELNDKMTAAELVEDISDEYPDLKGIKQQLIIALNKTTGSEDEMLEDGDEISILPPVSGG